MTPRLAPREDEHDDGGGGTERRGGRRPPVAPQLRVLLHHPARYLAVCKPADVRIDGDFRHTVLKLAHAYLRQSRRGDQLAQVRFVHRLDYATSGVMLLALSRPAAAAVSRQFESRLVQKSYVAIVHGAILRRQFSVHARVADRDKSDFLVRVAPQGRDSFTEGVVLEYGTFNGMKVSKVLLMPRSGRRHQLRVHCALMGHAIVGDATYASSSQHCRFAARNAPKRMMLHAAALEVRLPPQADELPSRRRLRGERVRDISRRWPLHRLQAPDPLAERCIPQLRLQPLNVALLQRSASCPPRLQRRASWSQEP
ncbi:RNA pseudouridylate synthase domain-containing protein 1 [Gracilariopsis chorda]|uniref:RNA pseudouridylate synthase domain-containing protein 1 n=1 Tax=Gracilariopsis chorda TaxID=448386 RepID=A0A2V3IEA3_9FLOR|nr:RNA pseudouridylate synthase domain-containing protein 1 [Gracilariopsis chorda]|eukprot:PXF40416.1 RNA pseudouridylate synthase domain-containing protein 1 [Gracilariopsis chorda]